MSNSLVDIGVYSELDQIPRFNNIQFLEGSVIHQEIELFLNSKHQYRIAVLVIFTFENERKHLIEQLIDSCDHVFIVCTELTPKIVNFILRQDNPKITYYICGFLNVTLKHSTIYQFLYWFDISTYFYRFGVPKLLHRLRPFDLKIKSFDILLGKSKPHRDFVFAQAVNTPEKYFLTYFRQGDQLNISDANWEQDGVKIPEAPVYQTVTRVEYHGFMISLSQIIPFTIYNQTAYSVVCETINHKDWTLFSEKIVKPIIARRLFVVFSGKGYLANLRKLGFQTFGSIIDESYDCEDNFQLRNKQAWQQVEWLTQQPQEIILEKIRPIVEHNFLVMMTTNWTDLFNQQLAQDFVNIANVDSID